IKITRSHAAPRKLFVENGARLRDDILESAAGVLKHQQGLFVLHAVGAHLDEIVGMSVDQEQIGITIIVVIKEPQAPAAQHLGCRSNFSGLVRENQLLLVVIKTEKLTIDISHEKI